MITDALRASVSSVPAKQAQADCLRLLRPAPL
jgi:hypothetical protein